MFCFDNKDIIAITPEKNILLGEEVNKLIAQWGKLIPARSLVFSLCSNTIGSLCGYLCLLGNKSVPVMLDAAMDSDMLRQLIEIYQPNYFWVPAEMEYKLGGDVRCVTEYADYKLFQNGSASPVKMHSDLALLLTTSGSTGSPKFVRLTYKNIESNALSIAKYLEIGKDDRPITSLPMHYSYGLSVINSHLMLKASLLVTQKSIMEKEFWAFFKEQGATSIAGVPYSYQMLKRLRLQKMELPTLKVLTQAGGKLSADLVLEFAQWALQTNRKFFVMYGQTEATARMSYLPYRKAVEKSASIGVAIPGGKFLLVDNQNNIIQEPDVPGELIYEGENVSMGYAERIGDLSLGDENNGILHTGDVAQFDHEGYYYIVGRLKRFVKIFGNRVNLDQTEQLVRSMIPDCACTGEDDKLVIHILDAALENKVKEFISQKTGLHLSAITVNVVSEIPKNSSGKILYSQLK